ncbi:MAG: hypothetical protein ABSH05_26170 [Bryobacteraceae bacterium]|jgi:hypothetical protein
MKFPFVVITRLTPWQQERYARHINSDESGWHRKWTESIWRRHQHPSNASLSGWRSDQDGRRRLIHFFDEYDVDGSAFVLRHAYLSVNLTLPRPDVAQYRQLILRNLQAGAWEPERRDVSRERWRRGDLRMEFSICTQHPEDVQRGGGYLEGCQHLEFRLWTDGAAHPEGLASRPWRWFYEVGLRKKLAAGRPTYIEPEDISGHLPAQVELGCGPSTEAGVPHLSNLHRIYSVSKPDFSFVFRAEDDAVFGVLADPEGHYRHMTDIYRACVVAEPTPFYHGLRELWDRGYFVGPVITNNFDCLCADMGLPEMSLRRYDTEAYFPLYRDERQQEIEFDPAARSLLVIGVHADRRLAQLRARQRGLRIIFIDPERYVAPDGSVIPYPVEAPQDGDLFIRMTAGESMRRIYRTLTGRTLVEPAPKTIAAHA